MRRKITIIGLLAVLGIGGFLFLFKREAVGEMIDSARGYPRAKTPQECVDLFKKAVKDRKYDKASKYCTKEYAEQLKRGGEAGHDVGESIDDLIHRMQNDGVLTSEIEFVLFQNDPLPPDLKLTVQTPGEKEATAAIGVDNPALLTPPTGVWKYDPRFIKAFYFDYPRGYVRLVKEGDYWKIDIPVTPEMRMRVDRLIQCSKDYVNAYKKMSEEVRTERTTKLDVATRLKELTEEAVTAAK
ncbi:MAG TPA: hypothetical protein VHR66_03125 [Gemmataceae bacterium]|jgi:hypothetical protein|nr:hypothetical protein [Gemmataceae bacterium]